MVEATKVAVSDADETIEPPRQRFTLGDAMLLIAFTALAFLMLRLALDLGKFNREQEGNQKLIDRVGWNFFLTTSVILAIGCVLFPMALLVVAVGLRDRRRRDVLREIGFVTCLAVALSAFAPVIRLSAQLAKATKGPDFRLVLAAQFGPVFDLLLFWAGPMVAGVWLASACAGRWRPGRAWADRLGWSVGLAYLALGVYQFYFLFLKAAF
jgi:hypothetical protein